MHHPIARALTILATLASLLGGALTVAPPVAADFSYLFKDLGPVSGVAISESGIPAGEILANNDTVIHSGAWPGDVKKDHGTLTPSNPAATSYGKGINDFLQVVGLSDVSPT